MEASVAGAESRNAAAATLKEEAFTAALLQWFDVHGRKHLPWQQNPTPYRVWVSEVMLQQTQVATVIPYFERFMARFPTVEALAAAAEDEVLHLWTGLGYYARARNLRACAQRLVADHGGDFPDGIDAVTALPGIGRSTAGAILALSRNQRHPILDGNVKRVLARVFGIDGDPSSAGVLAALWARAEACTPSSRVAAYTQAIMDLGATVCTRARPACTVCSMSGDCTAAREGRQAELPGAKQRRARKAREATLLIAETGAVGARAILLERRPAPGIWGGLWSPPQFESETAALEWCRREVGGVFEIETERLAPINHAFTHFDLRLRPIRVRCTPAPAVRDGDDRLWYALDAPPRVGLPQPILQLFARLLSG
ncbi:MAG: A/G-specific adenine glycosylase [Gammaproteobacteria bacterium]|nr:A/G-specific adenine glycosylase [Gammaproteobacteria bacterium]